MKGKCLGAFSSPEAVVLFVNTKNCIANQDRNPIGKGQRSEFLVFSKRIAASGDENGTSPVFKIRVQVASDPDQQ